jgi:hypothetical protein
MGALVMSERPKNRATGFLALVIGVVLMFLATTDVPGALAALPVGGLFAIIGVALLWPRRQIG